MPSRARYQKKMKALFMLLGVLIVALIVVLIITLATGGGSGIKDLEEKQIETGVFTKGVSIAGVDVSGMTYKEAISNEQINGKAQEIVDSFTYAFNVNGKQYSYTAAELSITSDLEQVLEQAIIFGNVGDGGQVRQQQTQARESGVDFPLAPFVQEEALLQKLKEYKPDFDVLPQDATLDISDDVLGEARFTYINEVKGVDVDAAQLASIISVNIKNKDYSIIEAPVIITNPNIDVGTLKANTKLISTYTSEFAGSILGHEDRVTNIKILADIVNGSVIAPGEAWSINDTAGPRNEETAKKVGWAEAPGISNGRYEDQLGGGVCQVSSSLYNAAIRAEMDILERRAHSWPSSYIDKGMDATISTGGPDLVLSNPFDMPIYMAAYLHEDENKITVEFYGPPLTHGYTIEFKTIQVGTIIAQDTLYHYNAVTDPKGNPIAEGKDIEWIEGRNGQIWEVYKQYLNADGKLIESKLFSKNTYSDFTGEIYANYPDPATVGPTQPPAE